ncbi:MAG: amino acid ABC transporter permease, partial [Bacteroidetes bacterium]|nr:amino acid ABC transporter permease [Bacteroidota bacterium]
MIRFCRYIFAVLLVQSAVLQGQTVRIGSKSFTESVILGEMITQLGSTAGGRVVHRKGIGGTRLLWNALLSGEIDAYPEYTGTIIQEILSGQSIVSSAQLAEALRERGIGMSEPLGFNNTYALGMTRHFSDSLRIQKISDLQKFPDIKFGFTNEFMDRADGWPALQKAYQLPQRDVRGLDHDLAYRALAGGDIQVMDLYSTDAEIHFYALKTLVDDLHLFPDYHAVLLYR